MTANFFGVDPSDEPVVLLGKQKEPNSVEYYKYKFKTLDDFNKELLDEWVNDILLNKK